MPTSNPGIEDLLQNDEFVSWVLRPDEAGNQFWEAWSRQHPDQSGLLAKARELVLFVYGSEKQDAQSLKEKNIAPALWERINERIGQDKPVSARIIPLHPPHVFPTTSVTSTVRKPLYRYFAAAGLIGLLATGGLWFYQHTDHQHRLAAKQPSAMVVSASGNALLSCVNKGDSPRLVSLTDGTRITLGGHSSIFYEKFLGKDKRAVRLEGDAFFDVAKDAVRPFFVHTLGIVTRVLGTSFRIIARTGDEKITVAVKTGKVAVRAENQETTRTGVPEYILQANQEVIFDKHLQATQRSAVTDPGLVANPVLPEESFSFSDTQAGAILQKLADTYSVSIVYDKQEFSKCFITVSLDALSLKEKLDLLCKVLGVKYRIADNTVFIEGQTSCSNN